MPIDIQRVNVFDGGTLSVGSNGAELTKTFDPDKERVEIDHADQFMRGVEAVPLRGGHSDVVIAQETSRSANFGFDAQATHYAKHRGEVQVDGETFTLVGYRNDKFTLQNDSGEQRRINIENHGIRWGSVDPAWEERLSPTFNLDLENVGGKDALKLRAQVNSSADVSYRVVLDDMGTDFDQHTITAQMRPRARLKNGTDVDFANMSVELALNEPRRGPKVLRGGMRLASDGLESFSAVDEVREGMSGVLTMPIRNSDVDLRAGETRIINFAGAVEGKPNSKAQYVDVTLDQTLSLSFGVYPNKEKGKPQEMTSHPSSSFELSGTSEARPAGVYELYEEGDRAAPAWKSISYTTKNVELTIPGVEFQSITGKASYVTENYERGTEWTTIDDGLSVTIPGRRDPDAYRTQETISTFEMKFGLDLSSTSKVDRDVDHELYVGHFDQGLENVQARLNGETFEVNYDDMKGTISFNVPIAAEGSQNLEITFAGKKTERRTIPA